LGKKSSISDSFSEVIGRSFLIFINNCVVVLDGVFEVSFSTDGIIFLITKIFKVFVPVVSSLGLKSSLLLVGCLDGVSKLLQKSEDFDNRAGFSTLRNANQSFNDGSVHGELREVLHAL